MDFSDNGSQFFGQMSDILRESLLFEYNEIAKNYRENRWAPSELDGGKFAEVAYWIIKGHLEGSYTTQISKPSQFSTACIQLSQITTTISYDRDSVRLTIPRVLVAMYDIRNHRSVGHIGGDVNPNHMDATLVLSMAKWIMAELIRILHQTDVEAATQAVETLTERNLPYVWEVDGVKRILATDMKKQDKILHLLYATTRPVSSGELVNWTETRVDNLKKILKKMHSLNLIYFNQTTNIVTLSPIGLSDVEKSFR